MDDKIKWRVVNTEDMYSIDSNTSVSEVGIELYSGEKSCCIHWADIEVLYKDKWLSVIDAFNSELLYLDYIDNNYFICNLAWCNTVSNYILRKNSIGTFINILYKGESDCVTDEVIDRITKTLSIYNPDFYVPHQITNFIIRCKNKQQVPSYYKLCVQLDYYSYYLNNVEDTITFWCELLSDCYPRRKLRDYLEDLSK